MLDGSTLFRVATAAVGSGGQLPVQSRVEVIEGALSQLVAERAGQRDTGTVYDPKTLRVDVDSSGKQTILTATDAKHRTPLPIVTVTGDDASLNGEPVQALAAQWQATLQAALVDALRRRQPATLARDLGTLWLIGAALLVLTAAFVAVFLALRARIAAVATRVAADERAIDKAQSQSTHENEAHAHRRRFLGLAIRAADPAIALATLRALRGILVWLLVLLWFAGLVWALSLFPQTTPLGTEIFHRAARIAFTWIGAGLLVRVIAVVASRIAHAYGSRPGRPGDEGARRILRVPTISHTTIALAAFVTYFVAVLATLSLLGISTGSVLTLGGLVALAVSLAAQNLVRDFLNGFLVLVEDQYVVGDYVTIGDRSGLVERMTLRVVQLRDVAGNLVTIPHSAVSEVVNASRNWSRVDFRVSIDAGGDAKRAIEVLRRTATELASDPHWRSAILEPVEWVGVDSVSTAGIVLRASIKTAPLRQFEVKRELNARIVEALRRAGIALGSKDPYAA